MTICFLPPMATGLILLVAITAPAEPHSSILESSNAMAAAIEVTAATLDEGERARLRMSTTRSACVVDQYEIRSDKSILELDLR